MDYFLIKTKSGNEQNLKNYIKERNLPVHEFIINSNIKGYLVLKTVNTLNLKGKASFVSRNPMSKVDVSSFKEEKKIIKKYEIGETFRIKDGPFEDLKGIISGVSTSKLILDLSVFGRVTKVEIPI